jgi:hypothetical protein
MSSVSASDPLSAAGLGSGAVPPIAAADLPADVRNGSAATKQAYAEGLEFEQVLVEQLTQQLSATFGGGGDAAGDGSGDGGGSAAGGLLGSDPATSGYASLIPQALSETIMSSGGLGIAAELARSFDPTFGSKQ